MDGCQFVHRGCAGIGRQLHPLKTRHSMGISGSKAKTDIQGSAYHLKALELASSTKSSDSQYVPRGCAGIGRQLHPLKAGHENKNE